MIGRQKANQEEVGAGTLDFAQGCAGFGGDPGGGS
jgi:hypothetical protein